MFSVRIVSANHYQAQPIRDLDVAYSDFRGSEVKHVPVIRIFGATPVGQKTCLHIHGVFPYIYVGCGPQEFTEDKDLRQFATSLDLALQVAMGKASGNTHYVFKVVNVQAVPMYGYHSRSRRFLKIYFNNPLMVKRAVELLQSGAVMNKVFQPHEAHIPFILQFFIDYNLYGMNLIHLAAVKFRRDKNNDASAGTYSSSLDSTPVNLSSVVNTTNISSQKWTKENIPSGLLLDSDVERQSVCELEVDAVAVDILNRHELQGNTEMNPGLLAIYNEERSRREVKGQLDDLHPPASPDRGVIEDTESEVIGKVRLAEIIQKQLDELKAITGVSQEEDEDNASILQDTLAEPSLTASQLILHDSQHTRDEDSEATPEEQSQPVINEELVQSLVDAASQRSSQYSQHTGREDNDLAQLLVDLAQDNATPEEGSILSSKNTQEGRKQDIDEEDGDVKESLEMSQAWGEVSDEEEETQQSHTVHDISANEEDAQDSQSFTIPQFDGGSDEKPEPTKKKTLGMKRPAGSLVQGSGSNPAAGNASISNSFPSKTKTCANKKMLPTSEKTKHYAYLADPQGLKAIFQKKRDLNEDVKKSATVKKVTQFPLSSLDKVTTKSTKDSSNNCQSTQDCSLSKSDVAKESSLRKASPVASDDSVMKRNFKKDSMSRESVLGVQSSESGGQKNTLSKTSTSNVTESSNNESSVKEPSVETPAADKSANPSSSKDVHKPSSTTDATFANSSVLSSPEDSTVLEQVPSTSNAVRFTRCNELWDFTGLANIKKNPTWNPVVMLIKCPIETDSKGNITFSGTSLPRKQLERIRKDKLKAQPVRRSSFSRKITPPRKFMDEQYWMNQIRKISKQRSEVLVDSTSEKCDYTHAGGKPGHLAPSDKTDMGLSKESQVQANVLDVANEPPCLLSPGHLKAADSSQHMPILEKITDTQDPHASQRGEEECVITKTKAILQEKYFKRLILPDKKSKTVKKVSSYKLCTKTDKKRYKMLSRTFTKLSLSAKDTAQETSTAAETSVSSLAAAESDNSSSVLRGSSDNYEITDLQNVAHCSSVDNVISSQGNHDGNSHSRHQGAPQLTKRKSSVTRKRKGSDGSEEWTSRRSPTYKRRSSQNDESDSFGRTYPFRKRERISYDDSDFPDVGFDIMYWSDEEEFEDKLSDKTSVHYKASSSEQQQPRPAFDETASRHDSMQPRDDSKGTTDDSSLSCSRKRGRPAGSKNKTSKFAKIGSSSLKRGTDSVNHSPRSKPHLTFTVDSMLPNAKQPSGTNADRSNISTTNSRRTYSSGTNAGRIYFGGNNSGGGTNFDGTNSGRTNLGGINSSRTSFIGTTAGRTNTSGSNASGTNFGRTNSVATNSSGTKFSEIKSNVNNPIRNHYSNRNNSNGNDSSKNRTKLLPSGPVESVKTVVASRSSVGPPISKPTVTQARLSQSQPTTNQLSIVTTMNKLHRIDTKPHPLQTVVNGHHSDVEDDVSDESALYRDAMWNLGYFSPRIREKEGSPPRCWSPSIETEKSVEESKQNSHNLTEHRNQSAVIQPGHFVKNSSKECSNSTSKNKLQNGNLKGSQPNQRHRESKKSCSTEIPSEDGTITDKAVDVSDSPEDVVYFEGTNRQTTRLEGAAAALEVGFSVSSSEDGANESCQESSSASDLDKISKQDTNSLPKFKKSEGEYEVSPSVKNDKKEEKVFLDANCRPPTQTKSEIFSPIKPPKVCQSIPRAKSCASSEGVKDATTPKVMPPSTTSIQGSQGTITNSETTLFDKHAPRISKGNQLLGQNLNSREETVSTARASPTKSPADDHSEDPRLQTQEKKSSDTRSTSSPLQLDNETPVSKGSNETSVSEGSIETPVTKRSKETPVSKGSSETPVSKGSHETPVSEGSNVTPVSKGSREMPVSKGSHETPVSEGSKSPLEITPSSISKHRVLYVGGQTVQSTETLTDSDETIDSSSDDFTPGQRKLKTPSSEDEDDTCNTSQSSTSTEASLSLDMSLIVNRIPSISPPRDSVDQDEFTALRTHYPRQGETHEMTQLTSNALLESRHNPTLSGRSSDVHRLTCEKLTGTWHGDLVIPTCERPIPSREKDEQISKNQESLIRTRQSGDSKTTILRLDKVEAESKVHSQSDGVKSSDSYAQYKNEQLDGSQDLLSPSPTGTTGHSDDSKLGVEDAADSNVQSDKDDSRSDSYSQLVCPDTPSPERQNDTFVSRTAHHAFIAECDTRPSCSNTLANVKKPDLLQQISDDEQSDSRKVILSETNEELSDIPSASNKESLSEDDEDRFTKRKEVESEEPMDIDTSQDTSQSPNVPLKEPSQFKEVMLEQTCSQGDTPPRGQITNLSPSPKRSSDDDLLESRQKIISVSSPLVDETLNNSNVEFLVSINAPSDNNFTPPENEYPLQKRARDQDSQLSDEAKLATTACDTHSNQPPKILNKGEQQPEHRLIYQLQDNSDMQGVQSQTSPSRSSHSQVHLVNPPRQDLELDAYPVYSNSRNEAQGIRTESTDNVWTPALHPPSYEEVQASLKDYGLSKVHHKRAFCGNPEDVQQPSKLGVRDDGRVRTNLPSHLPEASSRLSESGLTQWQTNLMTLKPHALLSPSNVVPESLVKAALIGETDVVITPAKLPPSVTKVQDWLKMKNAECVHDEKQSGKEVQNKNEVDVKQGGGATNVDDLTDVPSTSKVQYSDLSQVESREDRCPSTPGKTSQTILTPVQSPKTNVYKFPMTSTPSSTPKGGSIGTQLESDSPRIHPFGGKGYTQPQHSTPCSIKTHGGLPVTPVNEWKRPIDPSPAGTSTNQDRPSSSSSMRQSLLFTPVQTSGAAKGIGDVSQIEGATPSNTCGFKMPQLNMQDAKAMHEAQHLTVISLELHIKTRRDYHPDPDFDPIRALFYSIQQDSIQQADNECDQDQATDVHGLIIVDDSINPDTPGPSTSSNQLDSLAHAGVTNITTTTVSSENKLMEELLAVVRKYDPDILVGYEVQQHSWGYLLERAAFLDIDLCSQISRLPEFKKESSFSKERDAYGADYHSEINIAGRITLNLWRLMKHEVPLTNYTFENVAFHVLHQRIPQFNYRKLTDWFDHRYHHLYRWRVIEYYSVRVRGSLKLLHQLDLIGRTSELARVFGIDFYSVLSRGSQFRVESMMLRTAKPKNYVAKSPSAQQRSRMKAPECIPLVMEPESRFYQDPVIVLDFQSLYPTMIIAYNYCYSTCLGRLEHIANGGEYVLGCGTLSVTTSQLKKLLQSDSLHVSPNGIVFVKPSVRRGVLPTMLEQILKLRLIVKKSLKEFKNNKTLHRMLNSRQLALKLIANVTYGYTAANFSGRMPCIEVGDSVVRKGRETLERAIRMVETTKKWGARVVYGDTDSMFVLVKGATKERAFEIGREIRDAVTADNPKPVKLKLEKVYHPCVLQSKKRYVGYSYESPDQIEPDFDAKGIETVRRDSCPAVGKILERALKVLFTTRDVSQVKQYVQRQFQKILDGQTTMQDLIFAKEYRGRHTYQAGACVPALEITRRLLAVDRRAEPRVGQRVPYVIVHGSPGMPLIHLVRTPHQVLQDPGLRLNTTYYLTRQLVPSLNRVFGLLGVDTMAWYQELPRWHRITARHQPGTPGKKGTISQYFASLNCVICEKVTKDGLCNECRVKGQVTSTALLSRVQQWQLVQQDMAKICASCCNFSDNDINSCVSLDCPIMYKTNKISGQLGQIPHYLQLLDGL